MQRITIRLARRDLATLDRLRGRADRSTFMRRLLRQAGRVDEPDEDEDDEVRPNDEGHLARLRALTID